MAQLGGARFPLSESGFPKFRREPARPEPHATNATQPGHDPTDTPSALQTPRKFGRAIFSPPLSADSCARMPTIVQFTDW